MRRGTRILLAGVLFLSGCVEASTTTINGECDGGIPVDHLVYEPFPMPKIKPAPDIAVSVGWGKTPHMRLGELYLEAHVETRTGGESWQKLDEPLSTGVWVGATRKADLLRMSAGVWIGSELYSIKRDSGGKDVRTDEFCSDSQGKLYRRPLHER